MRFAIIALTIACGSCSSDRQEALTVAAPSQMAALRFTGSNPPIETLRHFPNWEYALDEEGVSNQDETTIRPAQEQNFLVEGIVYTAGKVTLANGLQLEALLEVDGDEIFGLTVFDGTTWTWVVRKLGKPAQWQAIDFSWFPTEARPLKVDLSDREIFPLEVVTVLPSKRSGTSARITIPRAGADAA